MVRRELVALARLHGVVPRYRAIDGSLREASDEALLGILRALGGLPGAGAVADALRARRRELRERLAPAAVVTWLPGPARVALRRPDGAGGTVRLRVGLEEGGEIRLEARLRDLPVRGRRAVLALDEELPAGVHRAVLSVGEKEQRLPWIAAPRLAHPVPGRMAGVFAPLYALRSGRRPDCADLSDLEELAGVLSAEGMKLVSTLPLDSAYLEPPVEPSPYAPVSRMFWNEAYLDLERLPELARCDEARRVLAFAAAPEADRVDWPAVAGLRRRVIGLLAEEYRRRSPQEQELRAFAAGRPPADGYATFRALAEEHGRDWRAWPDPPPEPDPRLRRYHLYAQWRMSQQMAETDGRLAARGIGLYLDMPLGVHPDGFDPWCHPRSFLQGCSAGAPPDPFFSEGQDWGFPPPHPEGGRADGGHGYFRESLRHHMRHCRLLRLDHVMGLHRVFCIPRGLPASEGVYLRQPAEELFAVLCLESRRHRCAVVGEDLGTVPGAVRRTMTEHGLLSMRILQFELDAEPAGSLRPPRGTLAALNTHDMPPFAAFWSGADVDDRIDLGLLGEQEAARERRGRQAVAAGLRRALGLAPDAGPERVLRFLVLRLAGSEADILILNLEDLWLETVPQNVPGTTSERPNWRRRMRLSLDEIAGDAALRGLLAEVALARRGGTHGDREEQAR